MTDSHKWIKQLTMLGINETLIPTNLPPTDYERLYQCLRRSVGQYDGALIINASWQLNCLLGTQAIMR